MSKIEIGRWSAQLRRMLGMKGVVEVGGELSPEISPTIQLEGPTAEWAFLKGVRLCGASSVVDAVVAQRSIIRLRNPPNSAVIAVVTFVEYQTPAVGGVTLQKGVSILDLATLGITALRDQRWAPAIPGLNRSTLVLSTTNAGGVPVGPDVLWNPTLLGNTTGQYLVPIVMVPGDHIDLSGDGTNQLVRGALAWHEREVPALEL